LRRVGVVRVDLGVTNVVVAVAVGVVVEERDYVERAVVIIV
jgi:hypothetical protein